MREDKVEKKIEPVDPAVSDELHEDADARTLAEELTEERKSNMRVGY